MEWFKAERYEAEINNAGNLVIYPDDDGNPIFISFFELETIFRTAQRLRLGSKANK